MVQDLWPEQQRPNSETVPLPSLGFSPSLLPFHPLKYFTLNFQVLKVDGASILFNQHI